MNKNNCDFDIEGNIISGNLRVIVGGTELKGPGVMGKPSTVTLPQGAKESDYFMFCDRVMPMAGPCKCSACVASRYQEPEREES